MSTIPPQGQQPADIGFSRIYNDARRLLASMRPCAKVVYYNLAFHADNKTRRACPPIRTIAKEEHISATEVQTVIRELEEAGLITVERRQLTSKRGSVYNTSHVYTLVDHPTGCITTLHTPMQNTGGVYQDVVHPVAPHTTPVYQDVVQGVPPGGTKLDLRTQTQINKTLSIKTGDEEREDLSSQGDEESYDPGDAQFDSDPAEDENDRADVLELEQMAAKKTKERELWACFTELAKSEPLDQSGIQEWHENIASLIDHGYDADDFRFCWKRTGEIWKDGVPSVRSVCKNWATLYTPRQAKKDKETNAQQREKDNREAQRIAQQMLQESLARRTPGEIAAHEAHMREERAKIAEIEQGLRTRQRMRQEADAWRVKMGFMTRGHSQNCICSDCSNRRRELAAQSDAQEDDRADVIPAMAASAALRADGAHIMPGTATIGDTLAGTCDHCGGTSFYQHPYDAAEHRPVWYCRSCRLAVKVKPLQLPMMLAGMR